VNLLTFIAMEDTSPYNQVVVNGKLAKAIILAGLLAGTLDLTTAMIVYKLPAIPMLKYIASGAFGKDAFNGGVTIYLMGLVFHYTIAFFWTILLFLFYPKIKRFFKNVFVIGFLYGIVIWLVMNLVVVPMTHITRGPIRFTPAIIGASILIVMIGFPVSILANKYYQAKSKLT
jgi:hypothetical protein